MSLSVEFPANDYPKVLVTPEAWADMFYITDNTKTEVGWMATVEQLSPFRFRILQVFLLEQEAHATTTELLSEAIDKLILQLLNEDRLEDVQRLNSWHHSHVKMGLGASADDNNTLRWFMSKVDNVPFVAIRTNQLGAVTADIGYPDGKVLKGVQVVEDLLVRDEAHLANKWDEAIETLVKPFPKPVYQKGQYNKGGQYGYYAGYGQHNQQMQAYNEWPDYPAMKGGGQGKQPSAVNDGGSALTRLDRQDEAVDRWRLTPFAEVKSKAAKQRWLKMANDLIVAEDVYLSAEKLANGDEEKLLAAQEVYVNMVDEVIHHNEEFWNEDEDEDEEEGEVSGR